jgi:hypothetical protein
MAATVGAGSRTLLLKDWYACGPLGSPGLRQRPEGVGVSRPRTPDEMQQYNWYFRCLARGACDGLYPMDPHAGGLVDLDAVYHGPATENVDGERIHVSWVEVRVGKGGFEYPPPTRMRRGVGLAYFSTWVYVPENTPAKVRFRGYGRKPGGKKRPSSDVAVWINRYLLRSCRITENNPVVRHPADGQDIYLRQGWNHVYCRHISAWDGIRQAMWMEVPSEIAGRLVVSRDPPETMGRRFHYDGTPAQDTM